MEESIPILKHLVDGLDSIDDPIRFQEMEECNSIDDLVDRQALPYS